MNEKRRHALNVLFTKEERVALQQVSARDGREEGPEVKWLVRQYAKGELKSSEVVFNLQATVETMVGQMQGLIAFIKERDAKSPEARRVRVVTAVGRGESPKEQETGSQSLHPSDKKSEVRHRKTG